MKLTYKVGSGATLKTQHVINVPTPMNNVMDKGGARAEEFVFKLAE